MLSESAWASVQDQLPGQPQAVSLGSHQLEPDQARPMMLMEVMPQGERGRQKGVCVCVLLGGGGATGRARCRLAGLRAGSRPLHQPP